MSPRSRGLGRESSSLIDDPSSSMNGVGLRGTKRTPDIRWHLSLCRGQERGPTSAAPVGRRSLAERPRGSAGRWADKTKRIPRLPIQSRSASPVGTPEGSDDDLVIIERVVEMTRDFGNVDATEARDASLRILTRRGVNASEALGESLRHRRVGWRPHRRPTRGALGEERHGRFHRASRQGRGASEST